MNRPRLFTIGHSNHSFERFVELLREHEITAIGDVRSNPACRYTQHFNREPLTRSLPAVGVRYVFLGEELGARRGEADAYVDGAVSYPRAATMPRFLHGLDRVRRGVESFRLALMCAEKDPLVCHRSILICRHLREEFDIQHIREDGRLEPHAEAEVRLLSVVGLPESDLFATREESIEKAYDLQGERIAYTPTMREESS